MDLNDRKDILKSSQEADSAISFHGGNVILDRKVVGLHASPNEYNAIVLIPPIGRDARIGSVFNHIFSIMYQTEQTDTSNGGKVVWDFSQCKFLHPFFLGALSILKRQYGDIIIMQGVKAEISRYLDTVYFGNPLSILPIGNDDSTWSKYRNKTYLPICMFHPYDKSSLRAQELVQATIRHQLSRDNGVHGVLSLLLGELIDNITEHSKSEEGYLFCQSHPREKMLYVLICDTGRSIFASYASDKRYAGLLTNLESSALLLALGGKSTKDRPENENRGYGISKSRRLIIDGLGGEFFILSGSAFVRYDRNGDSVADVPEDFRWNGTIVLLKIPTEIPKDFNIYKYIC